jgi:hypothetical protein
VEETLKIDAAITARLYAALEREGFPAAEVTTSQGKGPRGTTLLTARARSSYPGTGVQTVLVDAHGVSYGRNGERDLGAFLRDQGLLRELPSVTELVQLVDYMEFNGLLGLDATTPPVLTPSGGGLELRLVRRSLPAGAPEQVTLRVSADGTHQLKREATRASEPIPIDRATALIRALDAGNAVSITTAIRGIKQPSNAREYAALARAAVHPSEVVSCDALMAIGSTEEAAAALREALAGVAVARAKAVHSLATEMWGPAFAARLQPGTPNGR